MKALTSISISQTWPQLSCRWRREKRKGNVDQSHPSDQVREMDWTLQFASFILCIYASVRCKGETTDSGLQDSEGLHRTPLDSAGLHGTPRTPRSYGVPESYLRKVLVVLFSLIRAEEIMGKVWKRAAYDFSLQKSHPYGSGGDAVNRLEFRFAQYAELGARYCFHL